MYLGIKNRGSSQIFFVFMGKKTAAPRRCSMVPRMGPTRHGGRLVTIEHARSFSGCARDVNYNLLTRVRRLFTAGRWPTGSRRIQNFVTPLQSRHFIQSQRTAPARRNGAIGPNGDSPLVQANRRFLAVISVRLLILLQPGTALIMASALTIRLLI